MFILLFPFRAEFDNACVSNPIRVGDPCTTSRQCVKLEAKCRPEPKSKNKSKKTCQCFRNHYVDDEGICTEDKDRGALEFHRLNRRPTYAELNPGRRRPPPSKHSVAVKLVQPASESAANDGSVKVKSHCAANAKLYGSLDWQESQRYFPLPLHSNGFDLGVFIKGRGDLTMLFCHDVDPDSEQEEKVVFRLDLKRSGQISVKLDQDRTKHEAFMPLTNKNKNNSSSALWVTMLCPSPSSPKCSILIGRPSAENRPSLTLSSVSNPWTKPFGVTPTHVSFLPASDDAILSVSALCTAGHGEKCSHDSDCRKSHRDLQCGGGVPATCECWDGKWDRIRNKCVK